MWRPALFSRGVVLGGQSRYIADAAEYGSALSGAVVLVSQGTRDLVDHSDGDLPASAVFGPAFLLYSRSAVHIRGGRLVCSLCHG